MSGGWIKGAKAENKIRGNSFFLIGSFGYYGTGDFWCEPEIYQAAYMRYGGRRCGRTAGIPFPYRGYFLWRDGYSGIFNYVGLYGAVCDCFDRFLCSCFWPYLVPLERGSGGGKRRHGKGGGSEGRISEGSGGRIDG